MKITQLLGSVLAAGYLLSGSTSAAAQAWPSKPIRLIVPFAPGSTDVQARVVMEKVQATLGQSVVIETKPGAGTIIGTEFVAKSAPDGYSFLYTSSGHTILSTLNKLSFEPDNMVPVSLAGQGYFAVATSAALPVKTFPEFVAHAKANPGKLNYVSLGRNAVVLMMESLRQQAGLEMVQVPFPGMAPARLAVARNDVQLIADGYQSLKPLADSGQIRLLFFAGPVRSPLAPDLPSAPEAGLRDYSAGWWTGVFAPAGTPKEIVARLSREIAAAAKTTEVRKFFAEAAGEAVGSTPEEFAKLVESTQKRHAETARRANIRAE
jgi:tripartite-type tricarboxylate transporter receptor subunit TctC